MSQVRNAELESATTDPLDLPGLPPSPSGDLTLDVACRTSRTGRRRRHEITIHADWTVSTPHDLETERIGMALGGYLSCLDLVDHDLPAVNRIVQRRFRRDEPMLVRPRAGIWSLRESGCRSCPSGWPLPGQAATHAREIGHVLYARQTTAQRIKPFLTAVLDAHGASADQPPRHRPDLVTEPRGMQQLWDCGLHPNVVQSIHERICPGGPPLEHGFYLAVAAARPDLDWLTGTLTDPTAPGLASWLAWTQTERDRIEPALRRSWLSLGVPRTESLLLTRAGYTSADVTALADRTGRPASAAATLAGWARARCTVSVGDLILLSTLGVSEFYVPSGGALDSLEVTARSATRSYTRAELALLLAVAGTTPVAAKLVREGVPGPEFAHRRLKFRI